MKTAIEQCIEEVESYFDKELCNSNNILILLKSYLETEKQQIIDAQNYSQRGVDGEIYYNMVYGDTTNKETLK